MDNALVAMLNNIPIRSTANVTISIKNDKDVKLLNAPILVDHTIKPHHSPWVDVYSVAEKEIRLASKCVDKVKTLLFRKILKKHSSILPIHHRDAYRLARITYLLGKPWITSLLYRTHRLTHNMHFRPHPKRPVVFDAETSQALLLQLLKTSDRPFKNRPAIRGVSITINSSKAPSATTTSSEEVKEFNRILRANVVGEIDTLQAIAKVDSSLKVLKDAFSEYEGNSEELECAPISTSIEDLVAYKDLLESTAKSYALVTKELVKDYDKALYRVHKGVINE